MIHISDNEKASMLAYYREYPCEAARDLLGVDLAPHQRLILDIMWTRAYVLLALSRGCGKSFLLSIYATLRAMLYPSEKIGIIGPSFRQAKFVFAEIEKLYDISPHLRSASAKKPTRSPEVCYLKFHGADNIAGSQIHALPIGDGNKIRGARYFSIVCDEAAQVNKDVLDVVIRGMMATSKNPMENVRRIEEQTRLVELGELDQIQEMTKNKIIMASTAFFQFNHFWETIEVFMTQLIEKREIMEGMIGRGETVTPEDEVIFRGGSPNDGQIPHRVMADKDRAILAFNYEDPPSGFMNVDSIDEARRNMSSYLFQMEYCFPRDTPVYTSGGVLPIQDVTAGDEVFTHTSQFKSVEEKLVRNYTGKMIEYWPEGSNRSLSVTSDHRYYNDGDWETINNIIVKKKKLCKVNPDGSVSKYSVDRYREYFVKDEPVHNLRVKDDESFTIPYSTVHNCTIFPADSEGFFPRSILDKAVDKDKYCHMMSKQQNDIYVMGIDPARNNDNFSISIFKVNKETKTIDLVRVISYFNRTFPKMQSEIRKLVRLYNIQDIGLDSGGGGRTIRDLLADEDTCPQGEKLILQKDYDDHKFMNGEFLINMIEFSNYKWMHDANHNLLSDIQRGVMTIPTKCPNTEEFPISTEVDDADAEISMFLQEIQNVVVTTTKAGRMHWDTPTKKQKKDRYSAVLIGHSIAAKYIHELDKPMMLAGGFWV
jgi:hypothetical protein